MTAPNGLRGPASRHSYDETVRRLQDAFKEKGLVFAGIDHSGEAEGWIEDARAGTRRMQRAGAPFVITIRNACGNGLVSRLS